MLVLLIPLLASAQQMINGTVFNKNSNVPLAYASIAIPNTSSGTMTNENGVFEIQLKEGQNSIQISCLGYLDTLINLTQATDLKIYLIPYGIDLPQIVVRSLSPLEYIKQALAKYPSLIADIPFETQSFFAERSSVVNDKSEGFKLKEAVFGSYYGNYQVDSMPTENQLYLYREEEQGVYSSILEENKKLNKKAKKLEGKDKIEAGTSTENKNESIDTGSNVNISDMTGTGPNGILKEAQRLTSLEFFKEKNFKKIIFAFGKETHFQGRDLIAIDFYNKRKIEKTYYKGSIYLDYSDLAIVAVDYNETLKVPAMINLLIKTLAGFTIDNIERDVSIRNQFYAGKWFPKEVVLDSEITLKQQGALEVIEIQQLLNIGQINVENPRPIEDGVRFDAGKAYDEQVQNSVGIDWQEVNVVEF